MLLLSLSCIPQTKPHCYLREVCAKEEDRKMHQVVPVDHSGREPGPSRAGLHWVQDSYAGLCTSLMP